MEAVLPDLGSWAALQGEDAELPAGLHLPGSFSKLRGVRLESGMAGSCPSLPAAHAVTSCTGSAVLLPPLLLQGAQWFGGD